jgi:DNA mismatch repair protein MutL
MSDIIQLLPDSVANQIAAGEVIQRPASVVKELVENSVDAGADEIFVIIKDSGRTLIQVIDNGLGMSDTDARLSFERHATSKIRNADDLFAIRTKGFRGEALASIAAVAQVILKTRQPSEEIGCEIIISGSELEHQVPTSCAAGCNFMIKNLFFNVPARRKFLKSNSTELKHIISEFQRISLTHPEISFILIHNDTDIYRLPKSNLRQRIVHVFGKSINSSLNNIQTVTSLIKINGFIGKPEMARKTTGEQFFFINNRYMRHPYFHRAVMKAYEKILPTEAYPSYFIFFDADPKTIDVNIHPSKTEIKFENEQAVFQILQAAVKETLGKSSVVPSIDFETEGVVDIPVLRKSTDIKAPEIEVNQFFNPFEDKPVFRGRSGNRNEVNVPSGWDQLYENIEKIPEKDAEGSEIIFDDEEQETKASLNSEYLQLRNKYILTQVKSGLMVIDQKRAHERILYEQFIRSVANNQSIAQRQLYPAKIDLDTSHYLLLNEIKDELYSLGFDISDFGSNTIVVNSCPAGFDCPDPQELIEQLLEEFKETDSKVGMSITKSIATSLAKAAAIDYGRVLSSDEMQQLVDELFACEDPNYSPAGKKIISIMKYNEFEKLLS